MSCAFAAHTNADHAHHTSASTSIERPRPAHVRSLASSVVTWVTAKTNTRSHSSSTGLVRRSSAMGSTATLTGAGSASRLAMRGLEQRPGGEDEGVVARPPDELERRRAARARPARTAARGPGAPTTLHGNVSRITRSRSARSPTPDGGATISSVGADDEVDVRGQRGDPLAVAVALGPGRGDLGVA